MAVDELAKYIDNAREEIRAVNHRIVGGRATAAEDAYRLAGEYQALGYALAEAIANSANGLARGTAGGVVKDYADRTDPTGELGAAQLAKAIALLQAAAEQTRLSAAAISAAQDELADLTGGTTA